MEGGLKVRSLNIVLALVVVSLVFGSAWAIALAAETTGTATKPVMEKEKPAATVAITEGLKYKPDKVTVYVGDTVQWKNEAKEAHTVTAEPKLAKNKKDFELPKGAEGFDSGLIQPGGTYSHTFTVAGTYKYFCQGHEMQGLKGEVVVKEKKK
jgi:plastocyanin